MCPNTLYEWVNKDDQRLNLNDYKFQRYNPFYWRDINIAINDHRLENLNNLTYRNHVYNPKTGELSSDGGTPNFTREMPVEKQQFFANNGPQMDLSPDTYYHTTNMALNTFMPVYDSISPFLPSVQNLLSEAIRTMRWNTLVGNTHELEGLDSKYLADHNMDYWNNDYGRKLGLRCAIEFYLRNNDNDPSNDLTKEEMVNEIGKRIENAIENGELITNPLESYYSDDPAKQKKFDSPSMTLNEFLAPLKDLIDEFKDELENGENSLKDLSAITNQFLDLGEKNIMGTFLKFLKDLNYLNSPALQMLDNFRQAEGYYFDPLLLDLDGVETTSLSTYFDHDAQRAA